MEAMIIIELKASTDHHQIVALRDRCDKFKYGSPPIARRRADCTNKYKGTLVLAARDGILVGDEKLLMLAGGSGRSTATAANAAAPEPSFVLDSGASCHATGNLALLSDFTAWQAAGRRVVLANGHLLSVHGSGAVVSENFTLNHVRHVRGPDKNLVSVSKLTEYGYCIGFSRTGCFVQEAATGEIAGKGRLVAGLFQLDFLHVPLDRAPQGTA